MNRSGGRHHRKLYPRGPRRAFSLRHRSAPLGLNVHIDDLDRAPWLVGALDGPGMNATAAPTKLTDPAQGDAVVGRQCIIAQSPAQDSIEGIFADDQMVISEHWAANSVAGPLVGTVSRARTAPRRTGPRKRGAVARAPDPFRTVARV